MRNPLSPNGRSGPRLGPTGGAPKDLKLSGEGGTGKKRDVFLFVISGAKEKNPAAAMALIAATK